MKIKIFTVTKDEYDLIEDFITFYGYIFGYDNLIIIDTGSTDKSVLEYYQMIKREKNVNIVFENGYENGKQGEHFTKYMTIEKNKNSCDFLLGLDTDNFLILPNATFIDPKEYINYFETLDKNQNKFLIHSTFDSIIDINNNNYINNKYLRPARYCEKYYKTATVHINFYRCKHFCTTYNGNHKGITIPDQSPILTNLIVIHYNNTGITRHIERTMNILINYKYINYIDDINFETATINYKNICKFIKSIKPNTGCSGVHRVIWGFTLILRDFIYELFKKYATQEFCTIENLYKCMYSNQNILNYINEFNIQNDYWNKIGVNFDFSHTFTDYKLGIFGNPIFVYDRCEYSAEKMISDFELFFDKTNNNIFTKEQLYNNCEFNVPYDIINIDILKNFFNNL